MVRCIITWIHSHTVTALLNFPISIHENIQGFVEKLLMAVKWDENNHSSGIKSPQAYAIIRQYISKYNSDVLLHTLQHVKWVFEAYLGVSNNNNNNNSVILFHRTGIIRHSLYQHPVESVLHAWQERPGNWNSHFNYSDRVQNTVKVAEGWKILRQQCMSLGIIRSYL